MKLVKKVLLIAFCLLANLSLPLIGGLFGVMVAMLDESLFGLVSGGALAGVSLIGCLVGVGNAVDDIAEIVNPDTEPHGL